VRNVDTRIYYTFHDRDNSSTHVEFGPASTVSCGTPCENELFSYTKHNVGIEAFWRFMPGNRLGAGYDHWNNDYEGRPDYDGMRENRFFVEYKNTQLGNVSGRIKYTYLERRSDFLWGNLGTTGADAEFLNRFVSAFDLSDLNRDEVKVSVDVAPMRMVDLSFEGVWRKNDYQDITFGRTNDKRYELYGSASFGDFSRFRVTLFGDYEEIKYDAAHRYIGSVPCNAASGPLCNDPTQPPFANAYNWWSNVKDRNWVAGIGADVPVNEQLMLKGSVLYYETDGSADFTSQNNFGSPLPIGNFDDTKRTSVNLKAIYTLNKNWSFTAGYAFEKWRYNDISHDGQTYTIPFPGVTNSTTQSYLNGYLGNTDYEANIFYVIGTYRF